jgi:hypothetical protein
MGRVRISFDAGDAALLHRRRQTVDVEAMLGN